MFLEEELGIEDVSGWGFSRQDCMNTLDFMYTVRLAYG